MFTVFSGVFITGAMGAMAPVILRKRLIAPAVSTRNGKILLTLGTRNIKILNTPLIYYALPCSRMANYAAKILKHYVKVVLTMGSCLPTPNSLLMTSLCIFPKKHLLPLNGSGRVKSQTVLVFLRVVLLGLTSIKENWVIVGCWQPWRISL